MTHVRFGIAPVLLVLLLGLSGCAGGGDIDRQSAASANASMGADLLQKKQNDQALTYFRKALGYDSDNFTANWGMAIVNNRLGRADEANTYYRKTLQLHPGPAIDNSYAAFLCGQGKTDQAIKYFDKAAAAPQYADAGDALSNAGLCLYRAHRLDAAAGYFRKALAREPKQFTALTHMAAIEYSQQDYLHARAFIERAGAVAALDTDQLLLAARIELAMNDIPAAKSYLKRHNANQPTQAMSLSQLEQTRS
ncbi:MAG: tetratricopeptide repeat protein [Salinisphaera sp.]|jgi:type IV pilus assembly protein PilF|nr:tetratricopeptide repeat protein [Salinisphaera sp.]